MKIISALLISLIPSVSRAEIDATIDAAFRPIAKAMSDFIFVSVNIGGAELQLIVVWLIAGAIFFTFYLGFINIRGFKHAVRIVLGKEDNDTKAPGDISHFQALATAVSGTVGVGNITHVAVAVSIGGPGAAFWLMVAGFLGMATAAHRVEVRQRVPADGMVLVAGGAFRQPGFPHALGVRSLAEGAEDMLVAGSADGVLRRSTPATLLVVSTSTRELRESPSTRRVPSASTVWAPPTSRPTQAASRCRPRRAAKLSSTRRALSMSTPMAPSPSTRMRKLLLPAPTAGTAPGSAVQAEPVSPRQDPWTLERVATSPSRQEPVARPLAVPQQARVLRLAWVARSTSMAVPVVPATPTSQQTQRTAQRAAISPSQAVMVERLLDRPPAQVTVVM